jgi:uroporphyrinogen-III synthase
MPAIEIAPPTDPAPLEAALRDLVGYDWVVFTSANGVRAVADAMGRLGVPMDVLASRKLAVVGPATATELALVCRQPDAMPATYVSDSIAEALGDVEGTRILVPQAEVARDEMAAELTRRGAAVDVVAAYRSVPAQSELPSTAPDLITFASSSAAIATAERLRAAGKESWLQTQQIFCIGPVTAETVRELGYPVVAIAKTHTAAGLVETLMNCREPEHA